MWSVSPPEPVSAWIEQHRDALAGLLAELVRFDTTCVEPAVEPGRRNQEADCQAYLRERLARIGAELTAVEPDPARFAGHPMMPAGHHWDGRPMTLARIRGTGGGRDLVLNGHLDVVSAEPRGDWSVPPFAGEVVGERLIGRGASDMKGGVAAMLFALEALHANGVRLAGDVWVQLVTDEETNGMGTVAMLEHQPPADGAIVPEPSHFDAYVACRGVLYGQIAIEGRPAHAEQPQPHWSEGGAVGAIERLAPVLDALRELNAQWRDGAAGEHPLLAPPCVVPTLVEGGEFIASFPRACTLTFDATYLPADADADGHGTGARARLREAVDAVVAHDDWLAAHPLRWSWTTDYPPYELDQARGAPLLAALDAAGVQVGRRVGRAGLNAWHDAASLGRLAGIPAVSCGPGRIEQAHTIDESISLRDLTDGAAFLAAAVRGFCGAGATPTEEDSHAPH